MPLSVTCGVRPLKNEHVLRANREERNLVERNRKDATRDVRRRICILSFSHIARDARVLRQVKYLAPYYDLTVIGFGPPHKDWQNAPNVKWIDLNQPGGGSFSVHSASSPAISLGRFHGARMAKKVFPKVKNFVRTNAARAIKVAAILAPELYYQVWIRQWGHAGALESILSEPCDIYHANDWDALPAAAEAARQSRGKLVVDLHEYGPLEWEEKRDWWLTRRMVMHFLREYGLGAQAWITVAPLIADRYRNEFHMNPLVIRNVSERIDLPSRRVNPEKITLVHHGGASGVRRPEDMIRAVGLSDSRYSLNLIFLQNDYVKKLKELADAAAPGRVQFHEPVPPEDIVRRISQFDVGLHFIPPTSYNNLVSLPNKFFDFINAGLAVCIGPSPSMEEIVKQYGLGCISPSFEPNQIAALLNRTSAHQWDAMREGSRKASEELNAQREMEKLVTLYEGLFQRDN